jgi:phosphoribosylformimino-5-aminoimidazole carboxamide ribonucleotide (ProFAR) isomerase
VRQRYAAEPGFITMNLPKMVETLEAVGIRNPIVCSNINKIGFRMCGGIERYEQLLASGRCRAIAMSVFASGAIAPREAIEYVCGLRGVESLVFGASSRANIRSTRQLVAEHWGAADR